MAGTRESFVIWIDTTRGPRGLSGQIERTRTSTRFRFESEADLVRILATAVTDPTPREAINRADASRDGGPMLRNEK